MSDRKGIETTFHIKKIDLIFAWFTLGFVVNSLRIRLRNLEFIYFKIWKQGQERQKALWRSEYSKKKKKQSGITWAYSFYFHSITSFFTILLQNSSSQKVVILKDILNFFDV